MSSFLCTAKFALVFILERGWCSIGDHRCREGLLLVWGRCSEVSGGLVVGDGAWNIPPWSRAWREKPSSWEPSSPGAAKAKASVVNDVMGVSCGCGKTAPRPLGPGWMGAGHRMCLRD